jgi:hypothetical protein
VAHLDHKPAVTMDRAAAAQVDHAETRANEAWQSRLLNR